MSSWPEPQAQSYPFAPVPPSPLPPPPPPPQRGMRWTVFGAVIAVVALVGVGIGYVAAGSGTPSHPSARPTGGAANAAGPASSAGANSADANADGTANPAGGANPAGAAPVAGECATDLVACLMSPPAASVPWTTAWGQEIRPTPTQYADEFFGTQAATVLRRIQADGVSTIAHETWLISGPDGDDLCDLLLVKTGGPIAAADFQALLRWPASNTTPIAITGATYAVRKVAADTSGRYLSLIVAQVGRYVMVIYPSFSGSYDVARAQAWVNQQIHDLNAGK